MYDAYSFGILNYDISRLDCIYIYIYIYSQLPLSRTRKGPGKVSDLARYSTYPRLRISCK